MSIARLVWAAQVAAIARWKAHAPLVAIIGQRIYDGVAPRDAAGSLPTLPYVVLDVVTGTPGGALGAAGGDATLSGSVWTANPGNREGLAILAEMESAVATALEMDGFAPAVLEMEFVTSVAAGAARQIPFRFGIFTMEPAS